jgi:hypothetical protein
LPAVVSTITEPGRNCPLRSAASIIDRPMRSLMEPPGFWHSSFRYSSQGPVSKERVRTSGVLPMRSRIESGIGGSAPDHRAVAEA